MISREIPFLRLSDSIIDISDDLEAAILRVARSGWYLNGPEVKALEEELAAGCGAKYCVAVSNGLDALRLMIRAYMELGRLQKGDEIIVPANTYIASVLPVTEFGLVPVPVEPDPETMNIDFNRVEEALSPRTNGIMLVHLYGNPAWNRDVISRLHEKGILVFEDNAQAIGAVAAEDGLNGSRITGNLGDCASYSFYPTKNVGAMGDAGAVVTNDSDVARMVRTFANYGSDRRYHNVVQGYNCRMDEIQAAVLRVKLRSLDKICGKRGESASLYDALIKNPAIIKPRIYDDCVQVWHQYVVRTSDRDRFQNYLKENGVATDIHYAVPPHLQPCYAGRWPKGSLPVTERLADEVLSLPIANVSREDIEYVAEVINNFRP